MTRRLATIKPVNAILPIKGADRIELAKIGGWYAVVKKGQFKIGDKAVYIEIDAFVPTRKPQFEFLANESFDYKGHRGALIRTRKLAGQISQGLAFPVTDFPEVVALYSNLDLVTSADTDWDLTELLDIVKYESVLHPSLVESARGKTPAWLRGSSLDRIQDMESMIPDLLDEEFDVSVKLDGEAASVYWLPADSLYNEDKVDRIGVCTDTVDWREDKHPHWKLAKAFGLHREIQQFKSDFPGGAQIQGEVIGPGFQKNRLGINRPLFAMYGLTDIGNQVRVPSQDIRLHAAIHGIMTVPYVANNTKLRDFGTTVDEILKTATERFTIQALTGVDNDPGVLVNWKYDGAIHEGLVFHHTRSDLRIKVISNAYLLKHGL